MQSTVNAAVPDRQSLPAGAAGRLPAVDFLRGLALVIVLLDHVEWWLPHGSLFQNWTLMGLGFSDAAEAFVFLSGFTFGWVYTMRIGRQGLPGGQRQAMRRAAQIYLGNVATVLILLTLCVALGEPSLSSPWKLGVTEIVTAGQALGQTLRLGFQPLGLGILCMYAVILPCMPPLLSLMRGGWYWIAIGLSATVYAAAQPAIGLSPTGATALQGWAFNPLAWQFLFVLGMACGERANRGMRIAPASVWFTAAAIGVILFGLSVRKADLFLPHGFGRQTAPWSWFDGSYAWLLGRTRLGPLRLLHFAALAHLVTRILPRDDSVWRHPAAAPLVACGRHSLPVYCSGTVLAYACGYLIERFGGATWIVAAIALDACLVQFLVAMWLDRRVPSASPRLVTPSPSGAAEAAKSS
jgi:hypothetical protein